jgi:SAM-dependent methyltransferase
MYLLSDVMIQRWTELATAAMANQGRTATELVEEARADQRAPFCYYAGTLLAAKGRMQAGKKWLETGQRLETVPACSYLLNFIERYGGTLAIPEVTFGDPRPWGHFSGLPQLQLTRSNFVRIATDSLPFFNRPFSMIDVGCGNGELGAQLIKSLIDAGKVLEVRAVMLVDPSTSMLELARKTVVEAFPRAKVRALETRFEDAVNLDDDYDLAVASASVHHMPAETKVSAIGKLGGSIDHFLLLELLGNHDYPELYSPEIAFSVYQVMGRALQFIFSQAAPADVQRRCADIFIMTETVSMLTQPRGERTEYHMLRGQWRSLLDEAFGGEFSCVCDATCYADPFIEQIGLHYMRDACY